SKLLKFRDGEVLVDSFALESPDFEAGDSAYEHLIKDGDVLYMVSKKGVGFGIELEALIGIKRNGKRVMKFRADDVLAGVVKAASKLAIFTKSGSALVVSSKEIPERGQAAVGVSLMSVRKDDEVVSIHGFDKSATFEIEPSAGKVKSVPASKLTTGRRGLKGTKVLSRGDIKRVEKV
ncbi:MAG: hypothetical protein KDD62_03515, partial [Bdellovibrionales bacterium]|nr:hypothetical protein [Bdellovibrionales bacterium]